MKKVLLSIAGVLVIAAGLLYLNRAAMWEIAKERITADMFVAQDDDNFDPGVALGTRFPDLHANYQGETITDTSQFIHDKGMVFIANRSVDW